MKPTTLHEIIKRLEIQSREIVNRDRESSETKVER